MALGFNNAPVNWAGANWGAYRAGENIAAGVQQGLGAVLQSVQENAANRRQKEREKKMREDLTPIIEQMSGGSVKVQDVDSDALPLLYQEAQRLAKDRQDAPLRQLQEDNARLNQELARLNVESARTRAGRDAAAQRELEELAGGSGGPMTQEAAARLLATGVDPRTVEALAQMSQPPRRDNLGEIVTLPVPGAVPYVRTQQGNLSPVQMSTPQGEPMQTLSVGGRTYRVGPGNRYFDEQGNPVAFSAAPEDRSTVMRRESTAEEIARLATAIQQEMDEIRSGDTRYGFLNHASRRDRIKELELQLAEQEARLRTLNQSRRNSPPPEMPPPGTATNFRRAVRPAPAAVPPPPAAPARQPVTPDKFFQRLGV